jgi:predicted transposase YbfD/YdcC
VSTTILAGYTDWPGLSQLFRLTRQRTSAGKTTTEVVYGITSLPRKRADARRLLELTRQHWGIENRLHYVRDVTFGEDDCRVRSGAAPQALAAIRNVAIHLLRRLHPGGVAAAIRQLLAKPHKAMALIISPGEN